MNVGIDGVVVVNCVCNLKMKIEGYNVDNDSYCDMVVVGIIDLVKVVCMVF